MAQSPEQSSPPNSTSLVERVKAYQEELRAVVSQGIEHPLYELKSELFVDKDHGSSRLAFVKLMQGCANSDSADERKIVIGADQKNRVFKAVTNAQDFDAARLSDLLGKYLEPKPK